MADFFVDLAANPRARKVVTTLGLPLPMPQKLKRARGPWQERPLHDLPVMVGFAAGAQLADVIADTLTAAGADPWIDSGAAELAVFKAAGEAWGRPPSEVGEEPDERLRPHGLVFDATGVERPEDLRALYDFFHPRVRAMGRCGRAVVLGRPAATASTPAQAAARRALEGFMRSLGREVGRKGSTAQLIVVDDGAEVRLAPVLRFVLSRRSAYISGQALHVSARVKAGEAKLVRPLEGRVALVTGAARGIGAATAAALAMEGAKVIVLDRPEDDAPASEVARRVGGLLLLADVTAEDTPQRIVDFAKEQCGRLDIVVHNAGITRDKTIAKMKPEWWDQTVDVNLAAVLRITDAVLPMMSDDGRIVCLSSIAGIAGNVGQTNYSATKAGIIGLVGALAESVEGRGIAVNAIAPGFIETRLTDAIPVATREVGRRLCNLSQGGQPEDIAQTVTFLSSPGAAALSGQVVRVCGGNFVGA